VDSSSLEKPPKPNAPFLISNLANKLDKARKVKQNKSKITIAEHLEESPEEKYVADEAFTMEVESLR
jgi:hypothetical protein